MKNKINKKMKNYKIAKRFFKSPRLKICYILIEELRGWESTTKVKDEEFFRLVDRLSKLKN